MKIRINRIRHERRHRLGWACKDTQALRLNKRLLGLVLLLSVFLLVGCPRWDESSIPKEADGWRPIYLPVDEAKKVEYREPRALTNPGKIMAYHNYLMITEKGQGIHVVDNTDPRHPQMVGFLSIPGCTELHFRNPILYADNLGDLLSIDLTDLTQPRVIQRLVGAFPIGLQQNEPPRTGRGRVYFECVDPARGVVVGWERAKLQKPRCYLR